MLTVRRHFSKLCLELQRHLKFSKHTMVRYHWTRRSKPQSSEKTKIYREVFHQVSFLCWSNISAVGKFSCNLSTRKKIIVVCSRVKIEAWKNVEVKFNDFWSAIFDPVYLQFNDNYSYFRHGDHTLWGRGVSLLRYCQWSKKSEMYMKLIEVVVHKPESAD